MSAHQLNIANGRTHAGTATAADASIDDRLLIAYALGGVTRMSTILPADVDGELAGVTPIHVEVTADALRVLVPPDFADALTIDVSA